MKASNGLGFGVSIQTNRTCYMFFEVFKKRLHHEFRQTQPRYVFLLFYIMAFLWFLTKDIFLFRKFHDKKLALIFWKSKQSNARM